MIIGFSGWPKVGKSTIVNHVLDVLPHYAKISFGDALKEEASAIFDYPEEWNYTQEGKEQEVTIYNWPYPTGRSVKIMKVRELLLWYGSEYLFKKDPTILVDRTRPKIRNRKNIILDDVRDPLEVEMIRRYNGAIVRIHPHDGYSPDPSFASHPREHLLDDYKGWDLQLYPQFGTLKTHSIQLVEWIRENETKFLY